MGSEGDEAVTMAEKKHRGDNREKWSLCEPIISTAIDSHGSSSMSSSSFNSPLSAMKRPPSSDSIGAFISMCPTTEEDSPVGNYTREFQSMLMEGMEEDGAGPGDDYGGQISEKKRRLSVDQVKALEKNFEMENKLEPERKVKLAQELGLQPRQVAVWFQNRRARWKTKQLERDYGVLKSNFDSLKHNYESLKHDNESLLKQIRELKAKLYGEDEDSDAPAKDEAGDKQKSPEIMYGNMKDGSSDSDSSAIVNDDNSPVQFTPAPENGVNCKTIMGDAEKAYQPEFVKIEEQNFFSGDESCNFFSDDQAPTLQWYCQDQWNLTDDN